MAYCCFPLLAIPLLMFTYREFESLLAYANDQVNEAISEKYCGCYLNNNCECPNHPHLCILAERTKDNLDVKVGTIPRASETRYVLFQELLWDSVSLSMKWSISTQRPLNSFAPLQNCSEVIKQLKRLPFFHFVLLNILNNGGYSLLIFFPTPHRPHIYIHISILYSFSPKVSTLYL